MGRVEGKVVVVTGAARGQGAAETEALAREGATVIATDVADEPSEPLSPLEAAPGTVHYHRLDVSRPEEWVGLRDYLEERHGRVDGLVNNAGITHRARLGQVELADWERVFSVNVTGALLGIQTLLPLMTRGGSIVNVGSLAGLTGHYTVAYTASKWALRGLSRVASMELGPRGVRVNTIHPGYIETPMTASAPEAFLEANNAATPLGRGGTVDEVAPLVVFLVSDESSFISRAEIPVDGGQWAYGGTKFLSDALRKAATPTT